MIPVTNKHQESVVLDFNYVYHKYQYWVWSKVCKATQDKQLREDIMQNIFLKFAESPKEFQYEGAAFNWLKKVTRSTIIDMMRKEKTYKDRIRLGEDEVIEAYKNLLSAQPLDDIVKKEAAEEVRQAMEELKPIYYEVVDLYYFKELTVQEISVRLHISKFTIYSRLSKAKAILYDKIGKTINDYYMK